MSLFGKCGGKKKTFFFFTQEAVSLRPDRAGGATLSALQNTFLLPPSMGYLGAATTGGTDRREAKGIPTHSLS